MAIAHDAAAAPERKRRLAWVSDNALVRAVGRIPLPIGGKLLIGFAVVAALLALVAVLGLVSLSQSNSRGERLRSLEQTSAYAQLLVGDASQLNGLIGQRGGGGEAGLGGAPGPDSKAAQAFDNDTFSSWQQFYQDVQQPVLAGGSSGIRNAGPHFVKRLQATLDAFHTAWGEVLLIDTSGTGKDDFYRYYTTAGRLADQAQLQASSLGQRTAAEAD